MTDRVRITDVGPRDGLQNEPAPIATARKVELVRAIMACGVDEVEVSSFVSRKAIPQLGDAPEVFADVAADKPPGLLLSALVPNERGMTDALAVNERAGRRVIDKVAVFTAASETFAQRNINSSITESIQRFKPVLGAARTHRLLVRGYISCALACPFEGPIAPAKVAQVAQTLLDIGCDEIDLGDTIGAGEAATVNALLNEVLNRLGESRQPMLTLHLHDTFGAAAECVREGLEMGVRSFDGAAAGLGGCPFATTDGRRAPGNIATTTLVETIEAAGFTTGVDKARLAHAAQVAHRIVAEAGGAAGAADARRAGGRGDAA